MTEEERQMAFILDALARLTATTSQLAESNVVDHARVVRLEESFVMLLELAGRHEERLDQNDRRAARLEEAMTELRRLIGQNGGNG